MAVSDSTVSPESPAPAEATGNGVRKRKRQGRRADTRRAQSSYTLEDLLDALRELEAGNFSARLPEVGDGLMIQIAQRFNRVADLNNRTSSEISRISRTVGREGKMKDRASLSGVR